MAVDLASALAQSQATKNYALPLFCFVLFYFVFLQSISFGAADMEPGAVVTVDEALVMERVGDMLVGSDMSKYII